MATGSIERTDLYRIWNIVQNTQLSYPRELIISVLRDEFRNDSFYKYSEDDYGFPLVNNHEDMPLDAGLNDDVTTRLYIGSPFRFNAVHLPAILVRTGGSNYVPLSFNRNRETIQNETVIVVDGYGNRALFTTPSKFLFAGAFEGSITVDIIDRDILSRDNLVSLCNLIFAEIRFDQFQRAGVLIKKISASAPTEAEDRSQEKIYKQSINLEIRGEYRREIPVSNLCDAISICTDFGRVDTTPPVIAPNLTINTSVALIDQINDL